MAETEAAATEAMATEADQQTSERHPNHATPQARSCAWVDRRRSAASYPPALDGLPLSEALASAFRTETRR
jgi:hypothetical protein